MPDLSESYAQAESAPLGDAESFELGESVLSDDAVEIAERGVGEDDEVDCFAAYEADLDVCKR